ncbi:MAG: nitroreductase family protein [Ignavibacteria bacterium]|jgi:nitroreductase
MKNNLVAWEVSEKDFPKNGKAKDKLKFFVKYAILAPSGHNTQPWLFEINEDEMSINLYADRTRALPVIDPDDTELIISCGTALENLIVAMKYFEYDAEVEFFPSETDNDLLAKIKPMIGYEPDSEDKKHFNAIKNRHTNRLPFADDKIDGLKLQILKSTASEEHINFYIIEDDIIREEVIKIIEKGDKVQATNKSFCRELAQWVHPNRTNSQDGIPGYAFGMGDLISFGSPFFIGNLNWGDIQAGRDRNLIKGSPILAVMESKNNNPIDWLRTGMALEKLLLRASSEGIAASYLNQPIEVPELREKLKELLGIKGHPHLIIRMGYGKEVKPTPRRDLEEVIK